MDPEEDHDPFVAARNGSSTFQSTDERLHFPEYEAPSGLADRLVMPAQSTDLNNLRTMSSLGGLTQDFGSLDTYSDSPPDSQSAVEANGANAAYDPSRPPGTFLPTVANRSASDGYQWQKTSTAYIGARSRTPPRNRGQVGQQEAQQQDEVTEEDWSRREEKRNEPVRALKASPVYTDNQDYSPRPKTPDPTSRLSKRKWEEEIAQWRNEWREIDAVRKFVRMGFSDTASRDAWRKVRPENSKQPHDHEGQLKKAEAHLRKAII
jgi:hypothetical protein|mmetsp:Transcript_10591/g.17339  ORF Transcript_10591/g.17339 Transcript_10591/m.17339 type:complete len:264 (-) Transcript_10591:142-933(-)|eukprot:CAMPEP_0169085468 /NCGR_PEP_ID=MMETSP1015-20121227/13177_1 /TAXON_ID=342587 /ORGANISM="Karlodinium micrum, Strain CCMP2283" /LENGTH=263 /DNA_ID=CAMNT_0009145559 /DNA_START=73 /DNA_END=864 /DNA_ORIENTATION=+